MEKSPEPSTLENSGPSQGTQRPPKRRGHCLRFWWLYLIIWLLVTLVLILLLTYVAYPSIARKAIRTSHLNVTSQSSTNPTPEQLTLNLTATLFTSSIFHPVLKPFNATVFLEGRDVAIYTVQTPRVNSARKGTSEHIYQRVEISSVDEFTTLAKALAANDTVTFRLRGKGGLRLGKLPHISVNYNAKAYLAGLGGLQFITVPEFSLLSSTDKQPDNANAVGRVSINNPSALTLQLGDVLQTHYVDGIRIANSTIPSMTLSPGNLTYPIRFTSDQAAVLKVLQSKAAYKCGQFPVEIKTTEVRFDNKRIPYFSESMAALTLHTRMDIKDALNKAGLGAVVKGC
ncbi:hypothetical protein K470DRAFT_254232 [Piedraia hortae CBS 480.64]|uniref:Uncharacterized protein n=1 Tax=Piedraia hortae CBS 480.64 TaxID=1314780 RepID=A0A6A7C931_9PEZI|nr:hypothetical protein K470DRAFT_254232 [Piedraia hortae CBS 480.64]